LYKLGVALAIQEQRTPPLRLAFGWRAFLSVAIAAAHDLESLVAKYW